MLKLPRMVKSPVMVTLPSSVTDASAGTITAPTITSPAMPTSWTSTNGSCGDGVVEKSATLNSFAATPRAEVNTLVPMGLHETPSLRLT